MPITYYPTFKNSSGNVGIGNINPGYRLDIKALTTNGSTVFVIRNANDANNTVFYDNGTVSAGSDFRAPIFYDSNDTNYYVDPNSVSRLSSLRVYSAFDTASSDVYANMRVMRNNATTDGMYIGYGNSGSTAALTRIFGGGATTGELSKYSTYTLEPGSFRSPIFYDSDNTAYYVDAASTSNLNALVVLGSGRVGGASSRSVSGLTVGFTDNSTFAANTDVGDTDRMLSIVNESSTTNAMTVLGFRVNPNGGTANAMLDIKFVQTGATNTSALHYTFNNGGSFADRFSILSSGNVGIGTISPTQILDVRGNIKLGADSAGNYVYYVKDNEGSIIRTTRTDVTQEGLFRSDGWGNFTFNNNIGVGLSLGTGYGVGSVGTGIVFANGSVRAPIFYDSDNTSYYINAAGTSVINALSLTTLNNMNAATGVWHTSAEGKGRFYFESSGTTYVKTANNFIFRNNSDSGVFTIDSSGNIRTTTGGDNFASYSLHVGGTGFATSDFRAPIFYDSNNTAFYTDPASTSVLNRLTIDGGNYAFDYFQSLSDFTNGTLVTTDIPATAANGLSFVMEVVGKSYNTTTSPFNFNVQGYLYNSTIINYSGMSLDSTGLTTIKVFENGGFLCFWWARVSYWNAFEVSVRSYDTAKTNYNRVTNITDAVEPTGTKKVTVTLHRFMRADVSATNSVDLRAPIFYDSDNTGYYINAAGASSLNTLTMAGIITTVSSGTAINFSGQSDSFGYNATSGQGTYIKGTGATYIYGGGVFYDGSAIRTLLHSNNYSGYSTFSGSVTAQYGSFATPSLIMGDAQYGFYVASGNVYYKSASGGAHYWRNIANNANTMSLDNSGTLNLAADVRAPIFYDSNNTAYYVDAASTSVFNAFTGSHSGGSVNVTSVNGAYLGVNNTTNSNGYGISLYNGAVAGEPTYGLMFQGTATFGTYGSVSGDWATYFTMNNDNTRGWIFRKVGTANVASISGGGILTVGGDVRAPIFYDSGDTSYYVDPASTSNLNSLTVAGGNATIYRDLIINGGTSGNFGNRIIVQGTATTYTLQDGNLRPTVYLTGAYPVLTLNHTVTNNANHGPTIQFAFNGLTTGGTTSRQILIGANGTATCLDFGFSGGAYGSNSDYNPHNGIAGYSGVTPMRLFSNGLLLGSTGAYPNNITSTSYALDVRGTGYASSDFRAPIFYDSDNTSYYIDAASSSVVNSITSNDYYTNGWFRSNVSGYGIYNQITGEHFYSDDSSYWNVASSSTVQGIRFRTGGYNGTIRGYIYANDSNDIGLLNSSGNWRVRIVGGDYLLADGSSIRGQIFYDTNNTAYYCDPAGTSVLNNLTISADANVELYKSQTVDMSNTTTYSTSNYYPVTISVPTEGCIIQIQNNLNSNVPSWATHAGGFTLNLKWRTNGSGWGTTTVRRIIDQYTEGFTNLTICGGITQMTNSSTEVVWLRGGGQYLFKFSRNLSATAQATTYTASSQSVSPTSTAQNTIWDSYSGNEIKYNTRTISTSDMYTPILYDWNNSSYYVDPAGTSVLSGLTIGGNTALTTASTLTAGNLSGTIPSGVLGNSTHYIGTTAIALNRGSASQSLTGVNIDGSSGSCTGNAATATTTDNINGRAFYNRDSGNGLGQDSYTNNGIGYVTGVTLFGQTDGGFYTSAYSTSWIHQIYGDFRTGQIAARGKNNGTWQSWRTILDSSNYTAYSSFQGTVYGTAFYSSSDVNYYLQPTNLSNLWTVRANNFYSNQVSVTATASTTINTIYNVTQLTLSASITTLTFSGIQSSTITTMWTVVVLGQGTSYSITWPAAVKWPGGTAPTLTTTLNKRDIYQFLTYDGGTTIYAIIVGQNL